MQQPEFRDQSEQQGNGQEAYLDKAEEGDKDSNKALEMHGQEGKETDTAEVQCSLLLSSPGPPTPPSHRVLSSRTNLYCNQTSTFLPIIPISTAVYHTHITKVKT